MHEFRYPVWGFLTEKNQKCNLLSPSSLAQTRVLRRVLLGRRWRAQSFGWCDGKGMALALERTSLWSQYSMAMDLRSGVLDIFFRPFPYSDLWKQVIVHLLLNSTTLLKTHKYGVIISKINRFTAGDFSEEVKLANLLMTIPKNSVGIVSNCAHDFKIISVMIDSIIQPALLRIDPEVECHENSHLPPNSANIYLGFIVWTD